MPVTWTSPGNCSTARPGWGKSAAPVCSLRPQPHAEPAIATQRPYGHDASRTPLAPHLCDRRTRGGGRRDLGLASARASGMAPWLRAPPAGDTGEPGLSRSLAVFRHSIQQWGRLADSVGAFLLSRRPDLPLRSGAARTGRLVRSGPSRRRSGRDDNLRRQLHQEQAAALRSRSLPGGDWLGDPARLLLSGGGQAALRWDDSGCQEVDNGNLATFQTNSGFGAFQSAVDAVAAPRSRFEG
jgi:hypothetical protein